MSYLRGTGDISTDEAISVVSSESGRPLGAGGITLGALLLWGGLGYLAYTWYEQDRRRAPRATRARRTR